MQRPGARSRISSQRLLAVGGRDRPRSRRGRARSRPARRCRARRRRRRPARAARSPHSSSAITGRASSGRACRAVARRCAAVASAGGRPAARPGRSCPRPSSLSTAIVARGRRRSPSRSSGRGRCPGCGGARPPRPGTCARTAARGPPAAIPIPVSATSSAAELALARDARPRPGRRRGVNLIAFETRFSTTWREAVRDRRRSPAPRRRRARARPRPCSAAGPRRLERSRAASSARSASAELDLERARGDPGQQQQVADEAELAARVALDHLDEAPALLARGSRPRSRRAAPCSR